MFSVKLSRLNRLIIKLPLYSHVPYFNTVGQPRFNRDQLLAEEYLFKDQCQNFKDKKRATREKANEIAINWGDKSPIKLLAGKVIIIPNGMAKVSKNLIGSIYKSTGILSI